MKIFDSIIKIIFPDRCPFCNKIIEKHEICCKTCKETTDEYVAPILGRAGNYQCVSSFPYDSIFKKTIVNFKFYSKPYYSEKLSYFLKDSLEKGYSDMNFDIITYVPMHKKDLKKRGYNQSELLAKKLSKLTGIKCTNVLNKIKRTPSQHTLKFDERIINLNGAFKLVDSSLIHQKSILIIDDVVTSGSTLSSCCKEMSKANPKAICCLTLTKAY